MFKLSQVTSVDPEVTSNSKSQDASPGEVRRTHVEGDTISQDIGICTISRVASSMTVEGHVGSVPVQFLIDTGAACTLISERKFNEVLRANPELAKSLKNRALKMADGTPLHAKGMVNADITIGPIQVQHEIVGARINDEGIIGYDFLKAHRCAINVGADEFRVQGRRVPCESEMVKRAALRGKEAESLHSKSEQLMSVAMDPETNLDECLLVELMQESQEKYKDQVTAPVFRSGRENTEVRVLKSDQEALQVSQDQESQVDKVQRLKILHSPEVKEEEKETQPMVVRTLRRSNIDDSPGSGELIEEMSDIELRCNSQNKHKISVGTNLKMHNQCLKLKNSTDGQTTAMKIGNSRHSTSQCLLNWKKKKKLFRASEGDTVYQATPRIQYLTFDNRNKEDF